MTAEGYGNIFLPELVENDVIRLLAPEEGGDDLGVPDGVGWLAHLARDVEHQHGLTANTIRPPRSWNTLDPEDDWPIDRLPAIVVILGPADDPERDEEGTYADLFRLEVAAVNSARTYRDARRHASRLAMVARAAVLQHLPDVSDWVDGIVAGPMAPRRIPLLARERTDTVAAYQAAFHVIVSDTVSDTVSLRTPPTDPDEPPPTDPLVDAGAVELIEPPDPDESKTTIVATLS